MAERLWIVSEELSPVGVNLLGQQFDRTRPRQYVVEYLLGAFDPPGFGERGDEPERTEDERPFLSGQLVATFLIPVHEPFRRREVLPDRLDGSLHLVVVYRQEAGERNQEPRRVDTLAVEALRETVVLLAESTLDYRVPYLLAPFPPPVERCVELLPVRPSSMARSIADQHITFE